MIARRNFLGKIAGLGTAVIMSATARGEMKHRKPGEAGSTEANPKTNENAHLRLWKANDAPTQLLQIRLLLPGKPDSAALSPLKIEEGSHQFSDYVDVPTGPMIVEVSAPGQPVVRTPLQLSGGSQSTLLVRLLNSKLSVVWIDDTSMPADESCAFSVYNMLSNSGDIQVNLGTVLSAQLSSSHSSLRLVGIKRASYSVVTNGVDGGGKTFHWNNDVDFKQYRKATLLIFPDPYGRVRPRINAS